MNASLSDVSFKPRTLFVLVFVFLMSLISNCVTHQFQSPYSDQGIQLAGWEKQCQNERSLVQWYLFWGAYPINKIDEKEFFPGKGKSYKLTQKTTWTDGTISALGGIFLSLTRKTWVISDCANES